MGPEAAGTVSGMPSSLKGLPVLAALFLAVLGTMWQPAIAATAAVDVVDNAYEPASVTVVMGDTVEWRWVGEGRHSVTGQQFDSHPECQSSELISGPCGTSGAEPFRWSPTEPGTFNYTCRVHGASIMSGTVVVEEAPSPEPTSESPSPSPSPTPTPSPDPEPEPEPTSEPPPPPPPSPSPSRTTSSPNVPPPVSFAPSDPPSVAEPEVASEEPSFEEFPDPVEPSASEDDLLDDEVAIPVGRDGGTGGVVWRILGSLTVIGTALTFGRVVLFGPPWEPTAG